MKMENLIKECITMKHYLGSHKLYVENSESKLIYMVNEFETYDDYEAIVIHLELVAGWDYINPDENNVQGWCPSENFVEDVQHEIINQYFLSESMKECLEWNDYTILDVEKMSPSLKAIIKKHNEN